MNETTSGLRRVAVLGANGQVGSELCLYLKVAEFCEPIAIARSSQSMALLARLGVECRSGDVSNPKVAASLLGDCDLIFDLALPNGRNLTETRRMQRARTEAIFSVTKPPKGYVLASTTSVFRFSASLPFFRAYRSMKLFAERLSRSAGSKYDVAVYIFRLGQVHGSLQSCSESLKRSLAIVRGPVIVPNQASNAIFVYSIAEAIRVILFERPKPATYTLVAEPAWTFADLVERYAEMLGLRMTIVTENVKSRSAIADGLNAFRGWIMQGLSRLIDYYKELLSAIVSLISEDLDQKLRFSRIRKTASTSVAAYFDSLSYHPFEPLNEVPGVRFPFTSDPKATMAAAEQKVDELIRRLK
jgi:nucleoside-diphosphate-sugar epimerase